MASTKDVGTVTTNKKLIQGNITPHKLSVLLFIRAYCYIRTKAALKGSQMTVSTQHRKDFCLLALKLIQGPELTLAELCALLGSGCYAFPDGLLEVFARHLKEMEERAESGILDLIQSLELLLADASHHNVPVVNRSSVLGLHLRLMLLSFDKLSFSQVVQVAEAFQTYYQHVRIPWEEKNTDESLEDDNSEVMDLNEKLSNILDLRDNDLDTSSMPVPGPASRRQAELILAQQGRLLQDHESAAQTPPELQKTIRNLLEANPDLAEAHYLSLLNCLRCREFSGALHSLHHCFDRSSSASTSDATKASSSSGSNPASNPAANSTSPAASQSEEQKRIFRYAALNLAALHATLGHRDQALAALGEAVAMAQDSSDHLGLQQALSWMHRLRMDARLQLAQRALGRSQDLGLWALAAMAAQALVKEKALAGAQPSHVFQDLSSSDLLCVQHSEPVLLLRGHALRLSLWQLYGKGLTSLLQAQLLLLLSTTDGRMGGLHLKGEATCLALCTVAEHLQEEGAAGLAQLVLRHATNQFPEESQGNELCRAAKAALLYKEALRAGKWEEAGRAIQGLLPFRPLEASLRLAQLLLASGQYPEALFTVQKLLHKLDNPEKDMDMENILVLNLKARALLLQAEVHFAVQNYPGTLTCLSETLSHCKKYHLIQLGMLAQLHLAHAQLHLGLLGHALALVDESLPTVLAQGSPWERGQALTLRAKCLAAFSSENGSLQNQSREEALLEATRLLQEAHGTFISANDHQRAKDALYLQALLFNEAGRDHERNHCAKEFRLLDEQHPTKIPSHSLSLL